VLDAGIVNEHVDAAKFFLRENNNLGDFARLHHIRGRIDSLYAEIVLDRRSLFLDVGRRTDAVEHDVGPGACEGTRTRETYAACRAGHDCRLTFQNTHFVLLVGFLQGA
jgi:hypothetical protein